MKLSQKLNELKLGNYRKAGYVSASLWLALGPSHKDLGVCFISHPTYTESSIFMSLDAQLLGMFLVLRLWTVPSHMTVNSSHFLRNKGSGFCKLLCVWKLSSPGINAGPQL